MVDNTILFYPYKFNATIMLLRIRQQRGLVYATPFPNLF